MDLMDGAESQTSIAAAAAAKLCSAQPKQRNTSVEGSAMSSRWRLIPRRGHSALYSGIQSLSFPLTPEPTDKDAQAPRTQALVSSVSTLSLNSMYPIPTSAETDLIAETRENIEIMDATQSFECYCVGQVGPFLDVHGHVLPGFKPSAQDQEELRQMLLETKYVPLFPDPELVEGHYDGFCKSSLWPLFHYMLWDVATDGRKEKTTWKAYVTLNEEYATTATSLVQTFSEVPTLVWIHDYHLLMAPAILRSLLPETPIGVFLHTPFPSSEIFRCLPVRAELLEGVLKGADLIGFQTYSYARHFVSCCTRVLGLESTPTGIEFHGHHVEIGIFPIGIDTQKALQKCNNEVVRKRATALKKMYLGKRLIVGRDKLDQIKGVHQKLLAFEKFLGMYPEWHGKVVLIQVTSPPGASGADISDIETALLEPGETVSKYNLPLGIPQHCGKLDSKVSELVSRINGTFGFIEWTPVHHIHRAIAQDEFYSLLKAADAILVTAVRDGMNTTAHEAIVCQACPIDEAVPAPLILSEFTGSAGSMSAAILVNPWDFCGVADAIQLGLTMPADERVSRHAQLLKHVARYNSIRWARSFVRALLATGENSESSLSATSEHKHLTPRLQATECTEAYQKASRRLILLDFDGTLSNIAKTPAAAAPTPAVLDTLRALCQDPINRVYVVSGRDQATLEAWLGEIPGLGLSAEHGCFMKEPHSNLWADLTEELDLRGGAWKADVVDIFAYFTERTQGSFIEHKRSSVTWHYRLADPAFGAWQARECQNHLENAVLSKHPLEVLVGKKNIEVRPRAINKGETVHRLLEACAQRNGEPEFILCAGDDRTDEDSFRALIRERSNLPNARGIYNIMVGPANKRTLADWHVPAPHQLLEVLQACVGLPLVGVGAPRGGSPHCRADTPVPM
jgi:trehalose 6-phosphate synthase/phosphatase